MDIAHKLAQLDADPALTEWVLAQVAQASHAQKNISEAAKLTADLHAKEGKIKALTFELAYYKRLKFSPQNEAFKAQQRDLFNECEQSDVAAMQAEIAYLSADPTLHHTNQAKLGSKPCPQSCRVSFIVTNQKAAPVQIVAKT